MPVFLCKADQALELDREYLWKESGSWTMNGHEDHWQWFVTPIGYNGVGGYWMRVRLAWAHSGHTYSESCDSFGLEKSLEIDQQIAALESARAADAVARGLDDGTV